MDLEKRILDIFVLALISMGSVHQSQTWFKLGMELNILTLRADTAMRVGPLMFFAHHGAGAPTTDKVQSRNGINLVVPRGRFRHKGGGAVHTLRVQCTNPVQC